MDVAFARLARYAAQVAVERSVEPGWYARNIVNASSECVDVNQSREDPLLSSLDSFQCDTRVPNEAGWSSKNIVRSVIKFP